MKKNIFLFLSLIFITTLNAANCSKHCENSTGTSTIFIDYEVRWTSTSKDCSINSREPNTIVTQITRHTDKNTGKVIKTISEKMESKNANC